MPCYPRTPPRRFFTRGLNLETVLPGSLSGREAWGRGAQLSGLFLSVAALTSPPSDSRRPPRSDGIGGVRQGVRSEQLARQPAGAGRGWNSDARVRVWRRWARVGGGMLPVKPKGAGSAGITGRRPVRCAQPASHARCRPGGGHTAWTLASRKAGGPSPPRPLDAVVDQGGSTARPGREACWAEPVDATQTLHPGGYFGPGKTSRPALAAARRTRRRGASAWPGSRGRGVSSRWCRGHP